MTRRDKLRANLLLKQRILEVDLRHLSLYNDELAHAIQDTPAVTIPLVRENRAVLMFCSHFLRVV
jgi:DNA replication licensing factor MCM5